MDDFEQSIPAKKCKTEKEGISEKAIERAFKRGNVEAIRYLLENGLVDPNKIILDEYTPLTWACRKGYESMAKLLIEKGANTDTPDKYGRTPLYCVCDYERESMFRLLIEKRANIDAQDGDGWTLLHSACRYGHDSIVRFLIEKGATVDIQDKEGQTPLHFACANGYDSIARFLIEKGAHIDAQDNDGWTPLYCACRNGHDSIARLLIANEASIDVQDKNGRTPLYRACDNGHDSTARLLIEKGAYISTEFLKNFPDFKVDRQIQFNRMLLYWIRKHFPDSFLGKDYLPRDMYRLIIQFYIRSEKIGELFSDELIKE